jgi:hypothetical protein
MAAAEVFSIANLFALLGWAILILAIVLRRPWWRDVIAGLLWPTLLSVLYIAALAIGWGGAEGSFASLEEVRSLFVSDWMLLAGWVHYLAFDLFLGAWIAAAAERAGLSRLWLVPILPLTFMFGPAGFFLFVVIRAGFAGGPATAPAATHRRDA